MNPTIERQQREANALLPEYRETYDEARLWGCSHERAMDEAFARTPLPSNEEYDRGYDVGRDHVARGRATRNLKALIQCNGQEYADGYRDGVADSESELRMAAGLRAGLL